MSEAIGLLGAIATLTGPLLAAYIQRSWNAGSLTPLPPYTHDPPAAENEAPPAPKSNDTAWVIALGLGLLVVVAIVWALAIAVRPDPKILTVDVANATPYTIAYQFTAGRDQATWPSGHGSYWWIRPGQRRAVSIGCRYPNERICFGAWVYGDKGFTWGNGPDRAYSCSDCCYRCGHTARITFRQ